MVEQDMVTGQGAQLASTPQDVRIAIDIVEQALQYRSDVPWPSLDIVIRAARASADRGLPASLADEIAWVEDSLHNGRLMTRGNLGWERIKVRLLGLPDPEASQRHDRHAGEHARDARPEGRP